MIISSSHKLFEERNMDETIIKRPRGRPRLSDEEKARRKAERVEKKKMDDSARAVLSQPTQAEDKPKPMFRPTPDELKEIERIQQIMAKADEAKRQQYAMPQIKEKEQGNQNIIQVAPAKEFTIDDEYTRTNDKPEFVRKDDEGWVDPERT